MAANIAAQLEAARWLLEQRNLRLVAEERQRLDGSRNDRASSAARNEQDGIKPPIYAPAGQTRPASDLELAFQRHLERLEREDASAVNDVRHRLQEELSRLDEFVREHDAEGLTGNQLAREGLPPLANLPPHNTRKSPSKEFALDASRHPDLDEARIHIEQGAALDDLRNGGLRHSTDEKPRVLNEPDVPIPTAGSSAPMQPENESPFRAHGERQRTAEEEAARQARRNELRKLEEENRERNLRERFNDLGRDGP